MKNISILKILRITLLIAFLFHAIDFFIGNDENSIYQIIAACLLFASLIFAFTFGGKLEQEKIEIENRKREAKNVNDNLQ